jgi:hypothetical protein
VHVTCGGRRAALASGGRLDGELAVWLRVEEVGLVGGPAPENPALKVGRRARRSESRRLGGLAEVPQESGDAVRIFDEGDDLGASAQRSQVSRSITKVRRRSSSQGWYLQRWVGGGSEASWLWGGDATGSAGPAPAECGGGTTMARHLEAAASMPA